MDSDYILDFPSDHHELALTAADIEAIGSGYASPVPDPNHPDHDNEHGHEHTSHDLNSMDHGYDDEDFLPEPNYPAEEPEGNGGIAEEVGDEPGPSRRNTGRNKADAGLSADEKKRRQRENNKKAAEKSRAKRKKDLDSTEGQVTQLRRENERLRARLASLRNTAYPGSPSSESYMPGMASTIPDSMYHVQHRVSASPSASPNPHDPQDTGLDRAYIHKITVELVSAKSALLEKHLDLERIRGREENEDADTLRRELLSKHAALSALRAEEAGMNAVLRLLGNETTELAARRRAIDAEVKRRGGVVAGQPTEVETVAEDLPEIDEARAEELKRTQEEEAASHTQVLAQAVRDVAMGEARELGVEPEDNGLEKDVYDIQPYIEQVMDDWHEHHHVD